MSDHSGGDFVAGFLIGALAGAAVALLMAPVEGKEIREQIKEKSIELGHLAQDIKTDPNKFAQDVSTKGKQVLEQQKTRVQEAIEEGRKAAVRRKEELLAQLDTQPVDEAIDLTEA